MNVFVISVIGFVILLLTGFAVWVFFLPYPSTGVDCHENSDWLWDDSCYYIQEKFYDSTLNSPEGISPVLTGFTYTNGVGGALNLPCWYRFRYVNVKTGGYSDFSDWTKSPVIAGSCCLPCPDGVGDCPSSIPTGYSTCTYNQPTIGVDKEIVDYDPSKPVDGEIVIMNLHRYVGKSSSDAEPPSDDVQDEIIGYLAATSYVGSKSYYIWNDVFDNPCKNSCPSVSWCQSSSTCGEDSCA